MITVELERPGITLQRVAGGDRGSVGRDEVGTLVPTRRRTDEGAGLVVDDGCDVRVDGVMLGAADRAALLRWLPLAPLELALFEHGLFADEPWKALALLLRPPTIWSFDEARTAGWELPRGAGFEPARRAALERSAAGLVTPAHLRRVRDGAGRISSQLPAAPFPIASRTVAAGCAAVATDDDFCAAVAATQLARFASSSVVLDG
jgi:hypothetical protein